MISNILQKVHILQYLSYRNLEWKVFKISNKIMLTKIELNPPKLVKVLQHRNSEFVDTIFSISKKIEPILNERIPRLFSTYTLHDIDHSMRIMDYMYDLITDTEKLSDLDITLLVLSAMLHDVGMAVEENEIQDILNEKYVIDKISFKAVLKKYGNDDKEALRDFIRRIHGQRSADFVETYLDGDLRIPSQKGTRIADDIAAICLGHTKDISWLQDNLKQYKEKGSYGYSPLYCGMLLRLADILDIDSQRTPPFLYNLITLNDRSNEEWKQHFDIHNLEKIKSNELGEKTITIFGECHVPSIHRKLLEYLNWINEEVLNAINLNSILTENYKIKLRYPLENHIEPKGYKISDLKLTVDFNAISNLLMGENIYGAKHLGLRELIQNSIDACQVRDEVEKRHDEYGENDYKPSIKVILDKDRNQFIVKDNGVGMSLNILKKYFLNIGVSYYKSDDYLLRDLKYKPIGNFGIGFLACFMLSENVQLKTKHMEVDTAYKLSLEKNSPYISLDEGKSTNFFGTEIYLNYKEVMGLFENKVKELKRFLKANFITDEFEIKVLEKDNSPCTIRNQLDIVADKDERNHIISLEDYLIDIKGSIEIEVRNPIHGEEVEDIPFNGTPYFYNGESLIKSYTINKLYDKDNHCINYIEIPILTESIVDEFERINEILEDSDATIERLEDLIEWITIFYDSSQTNCLIKENTEISRNDDIFESFGFNDLIQFGQDISLPTVVYSKSYNLYYSPDENIFLPFYLQKERIYTLRYNKKKKGIYLKSVLVPTTNFYPDKMWSFIAVKAFNINIFNSSITTEVSRNKLDNFSDKMLQYALNKCICLWALDNLEFTRKQIKTLEDFISDFYDEDNELIKKFPPN